MTHCRWNAIHAFFLFLILFNLGDFRLDDEDLRLFIHSAKQKGGALFIFLFSFGDFRLHDADLRLFMHLAKKKKGWALKTRFWAALPFWEQITWNQCRTKLLCQHSSEVVKSVIILLGGREN